MSPFLLTLPPEVNLSYFSVALGFGQFVFFLCFFLRFLGCLPEKPPVAGPEKATLNLVGQAGPFLWGPK